jgi:hypothetical protein
MPQNTTKLRKTLQMITNDCYITVPTKKGPENVGEQRKTRENAGKRRENAGKTRENAGKRGKTQENAGKRGKRRKNRKTPQNATKRHKTPQILRIDNKLLQDQIFRGAKKPTPFSAVEINLGPKLGGHGPLSPPENIFSGILLSVAFPEILTSCCLTE